MNFLDGKELQKHAMKARYGWRRFFVPVPRSIKNDAFNTAHTVRNNGGRPEEQTQARLDFVRKYPVKD